MKFKNYSSSKKIILEIAPLIDVVFLLLIFFMLTSSFVLQPGIKVKLPQAKSAVTQSARNIVITITQMGDLYLNNDKILVSELKVKLQTLLKKSKNGIVIIKADRDTLHGYVVRVLDIAKTAGAQKLAIATTPERIERK